MLLDFNQFFLAPDSTQLNGDENKMSIFLSTIIAMAPSFGVDALKFNDISRSLYESGTVELDNTDLTKLYNFIRDRKESPNFVTAQLLQLIDDARVKDLAAKRLGE